MFIVQASKKLDKAQKVNWREEKKAWGHLASEIRDNFSSVLFKSLRE